MSERMTDERLREIEKIAVADFTHVGFKSADFYQLLGKWKGVVRDAKDMALRECVEEINRLNRLNVASGNIVMIANGKVDQKQREIRKLRELLEQWRKWRGKDVTYTGKGDNPSPFGATCAFLDGDKSKIRAFLDGDKS